MRRSLSGIFGEPAPKGFKFPQSSEYVAGLINATKSVQPLVRTSGGSPDDILTAPIKAQVVALSATLEGSTGLTLSNLSNLATSIYSLATSTNTVDTMHAVSDLLNGALEIATAVMQAAGAAADMVNAVPVIGQIASLLMDFMIGVVEAEYQTFLGKIQCQKDVDEFANEWCRGLIDDARPVPTGRENTTTPADLFRPVAYANWKGDQLLPLTTASVYVELCGREAKGLASKSYETHLAYLRKKNKKLGIPPQTQRRMWSLIEGIFAAVEPPLRERPTGADGGRALFPVLQDMVRGEYHAGRLNDELIERVSNDISARHRISLNCPQYAAGGGAMPAGAATCAPRVNLAASFGESLRRFENKLFDEFWDFSKGEWGIAAKTKIVAPPKGLLFIQANVASALLVDAARIKSAARRETPLTRGQKTLLGAAGISGGYLTYLGVRRYAR